MTGAATSLGKAMSQRSWSRRSWAEVLNTTALDLLRRGWIVWTHPNASSGQLEVARRALDQSHLVTVAPDHHLTLHIASDHSRIDVLDVDDLEHTLRAIDRDEPNMIISPTLSRQNENRAVSTVAAAIVTGKRHLGDGSAFSHPGLVVEDGDLLVEDLEIEVRSFPGVVRAGLGATVWAHPGVVVDAVDGATVHLAAGAHIEQHRPGALERADATVTVWHHLDRTGAPQVGER